MVEVGIDLREYYPSVEWDILGVPAERHERYYPCCQEPYPGEILHMHAAKLRVFFQHALMLVNMLFCYPLLSTAHIFNIAALRTGALVC